MTQATRENKKYKSNREEYRVSFILHQVGLKKRQATDVVKGEIVLRKHTVSPLLHLEEIYILYFLVKSLNVEKF